MLPIQQKARPIPYHLQKDVKNELDRIIKSGHLERLETIEEYCFVSPVLITVKKDKTVKITLDARKLNKSFVKKRPHMPNMEEILNPISAELSRDDHDPTDIRNRPRQRLRTNETSTRNQQPLLLHSRLRKYERLPPIPEGISRPSRLTNQLISREK